jgi:hypothetical protein
VVSLAILLTELAIRRPFGELITAEDLNKDGTIHPASDLLAANRLVDRVYDEHGQRYGDAVRRCVTCNFDQRNTSL